MVIRQSLPVWAKLTRCSSSHVTQLISCDVTQYKYPCDKDQLILKDDRMSGAICLLDDVICRLVNGRTRVQTQPEHGISSVISAS
ncbi:hypothetical protein M8J77_015061 [Diaphorina citri]|nr:hypothetical protein M8J77_015061 [Diaphorina citri]